MSETPSFQEDHISQVPALQLLINMGYTYLSPEEAFRERGGKTSNVILEKILDKQLRKMNKIVYKGNTYEFSNNNINGAIDAIKNIPFDGLVRTNEKIYELLSLGKSFEETIQGNIRSFTLNYIDWDNKNNVFHVTEEFEVEKEDRKSSRRPDIVLFVNGIPFVVIECKRPDMKEPLEEAISQSIRNQRNEEIPKLFIYSQLLLAISKNESKYGTVSTPLKFWSVWREKEDYEEVLANVVNKPLSTERKEKLFSERFNYVRKYFDSLEISERLVTEQDKAIYSLCRPERLLELSYQFIVFDMGYKKIARYKQYFAVKNAMERVKKFKNTENKQREGGVIWHDQGSGKSILMAMLSKAIAIDKEIENPRIVLITDRIDLDKQIFDTFKHCGMEPVQANTGAHLLELLEKDKKAIITTVLDKFRAGLNKKTVKITSENIFVLVDESHRSQYGSDHAMMERVLPNACYIGFTGTPLTKKERNTLEKFGGFIDIYTSDEAIRDKVVVPLLYEGRLILQEVNKTPIDTWFDRHTASLSEQQKVDLKKKFSRIEKLNLTDQKIYMVAYDISEHYSKNWQATGFKAQIATSSKIEAIKFKGFLDNIGLVSSEVIISPPDDREGFDDIYEEPKEEVSKFWKKMMERFGSEKEYNKQIIDAFNSDDNPEILIVVDKLLTGFDSPRNTILYIAKPLKEHTLLQAIKRVNRIHEGKDFGFIIDYRGILGELDAALSSYSALAGFDEKDLEGTLSNVGEEVKTLPQKYSEVWDLFKDIKNKKDAEEFEKLLFDEELRTKFYEKLSLYSRILNIAISTKNFYEDNSEEQVNKYINDLKFFQHLRKAVKQRYAEEIDYKEYEPIIMKLLNRYVDSSEAITITKQVNIFDKENFNKEIEKIQSKAAKADTIAHRTIKSIEERFDEDPIFYDKFSKILEKVIEDYRKERILEAEYFNKVNEVMETVRDRKDTDLPIILKHKDVAKAFYGVVYDVIGKGKDDNKIKELSASAAIKIDDIIISHKVVDWHLKEDIQNKMKNEIEDYLADDVELKISYDDIDLIMEKVLNIAKKRYSY